MINQIFDYFGIVVPGADAGILAVIIFIMSTYVMVFVLRETFGVLRSVLELYLQGGSRRW